MLIDFKNFSVESFEGDKILKNIDLQIFNNSSNVAILGKNGSGKSTLMNSILMFNRDLKINGTILVDNLEVNNKNIKIIRDEVKIVFQNPSIYLNPIMSIGAQIDEATKSRDKTIQMLEIVKLRRSVLNMYPYQLSGGMAQRVLILIAISSNPKILLADEPFSFLDLELRRDLLNLFRDLQDKFNFSILMITHNLSVLKSFIDEVIILDKGIVVEKGDVGSVMKNPQSEISKIIFKDFI
jgi:ABC-type dipeptide/oligopeptide/nickel transport system ATPase component